MIVTLMTKLMIIFRSRDILSYIITDGQKNKIPSVGGRIYRHSGRKMRYIRKHYRKTKGLVLFGSKINLQK